MVDNDQRIERSLQDAAGIAVLAFVQQASCLFQGIGIGGQRQVERAHTQFAGQVVEQEAASRKIVQSDCGLSRGNEPFDVLVIERSNINHFNGNVDGKERRRRIASQKDIDLARGIFNGRHCFVFVAGCNRVDGFPRVVDSGHGIGVEGALRLLLLLIALLLNIRVQVLLLTWSRWPARVEKARDSKEGSASQMDGSYSLR